MRALIIVVGVIVVGFVFTLASLYIVKEGEQVVVTQFGKPVGIETEAGLKFKAPFIQEVHRLEKRLLPWDGDAELKQTRDKKQIFVDVWARWKIVEPQKFFQALRNEQQGSGILDKVVDSAVGVVVARHNLIEVVRSSNRKLEFETDELARDYEERKEQIVLGRAGLEKEILELAGTDLEEQYGMKLTMVRIKRINYNETVRITVYGRMKSERLRIAQRFASEGKETENKILGRMQRELEGIKGQMQQESSEIRGKADAEVIQIAADAYSKSPEFFDFLRSLEAYKKTLKRGTRLILSTDNKFLKHLRTTENESKSK